MVKKNVVLFFVLILPYGLVLQAQGTVESAKVYSPSLEGNLIGDDATRDVSVYLPPSYQNNSQKHYPVLYMLHGFTDSNTKWFGGEDHWINLPEILDQAFSQSGAKEMIVVMPNAYNRFQGSMYSSSATIGDWETFVAKDLVNYIDEKYRTIPEAGSRGLAGHSMGGYGTIRIGMKNPDIFSSLYLLSACCMGPSTGFATNPGAVAVADTVDTFEEIDRQGFFTLAILATTAAWSPDPNNPPFYFRLPAKDGEVIPEIVNKFEANTTLVVIDQYIPNLKRLKAIAADVGDRDMGIAQATRLLHEKLDEYQIEHTYEVYEGDHVNRIGERILTKTIPFFEEHLKFE